MTTIDQKTSHKQTRLHYLDWFRVFACIAVVTIHVTAGAIGSYLPKSVPQIGVTLLNGLMLFAVPAFIAISGYTFMVVTEGKVIRFSDFLKKRLNVIVVPYILWNILYYFYGLKVSNGAFDFQTMLYDLITGKAFYHLYFMPLIFQFYILFLPLKKVVERYDWKLISVATIAFHWIYVHTLKPQILLSDRVFLSYLVFYLFGMLLGKYHRTILKVFRHYWWMIGIGYIITEGFYLWDRILFFVYQANPPIRLPYAWELSSIFSIMVLLLIAEIASNHYKDSTLNQWMIKTSSVSFDIYLAHPLILSLLTLNFPRFGVNSLTLQLILQWTLGILLPLVAALIFKRFKRTLSQNSN